MAVNVGPGNATEVSLKQKNERQKLLSEVGFEPTPSYEDQNSLMHSLSREQGKALSLAP